VSLRMTRRVRGDRRRRRSSRRLPLAALLAVAVAAGLAATPSPARAVVTGPSVTIVSPSPDGTQSGAVDFTVTIDQQDTGRVTEVYLEMYGGWQAKQAKLVTIAPGQCAPTCTISQSFDTRTLVVPQTALSVDENLPDGLVEIAATVYTSLGPYTTVQSRFTLDNARPTISLPDLPFDPYTQQYAPWAGDDRLRTTVATTPSAATNEPIDSLRIIVPHSPAIPLGNETLPAPSGGTGLLDVDITKLLPGSYVGYLAAIDHSGLSSALLKIAFRVGHYTISAAVYGVFHSDYGDIIVRPTWINDTTGPWIDSIDAYLDGVLVGHTNGFMHPHIESGVRLQNHGSPFKVGTHTVRLSVTDNRGIIDELTLPVHVVDPVELSWAIRAAVTGEPTAVTVDATSATSPISSVTLADERGAFAKATGTAWSNQLTVRGSVTETVAGTHDLAATVVQTDGYSYLLHHSFVVSQAAVTAAYVASSRAGSAVYINGLVKQTIGGGWTRSANRIVYLQRYLDGHWQTLLARTTNAQGQLAVGFIQSRVLPYRLYVAASTTAHAATSASTTR
jgi:hypothetical protein